VGDTLTEFESTEAFVDCVATGTDYMYNAGEAILYDNPNQGVLGHYTRIRNTLARCCGALSFSEAGFGNTCTAPCTRPYSGQDVINSRHTHHLKQY